MEYEFSPVQCMMDPDIPKFTPFEDDGGLLMQKESMIGTSLFTSTPVKVDETDKSSQNK